MTSSLNPWGEMGVTSACGFARCFFQHPNKSREKHLVMTRAEKLGGVEPPSPGRGVFEQRGVVYT